LNLNDDEVRNLLENISDVMDKTSAERYHLRGGLTLIGHDDAAVQVVELPTNNLKGRLDWREQSVVTPVKHQR
jgi:hypothetical protein